MKTFKKTIAIIFSGISILNCSAKAGYLTDNYDHYKKEIKIHAQSDPFFSNEDNFNFLIAEFIGDTEAQSNVNIEQKKISLAVMLINHGLNQEYNKTLFFNRFIFLSRNKSEEFYSKNIILFDDVWSKYAEYGDIKNKLRGLIECQGNFISYFNFDESRIYGTPEDKFNYPHLADLLNKVVYNLLINNPLIIDTHNIYNTYRNDVYENSESSPNLCLSPVSIQQLLKNDATIAKPIPIYPPNAYGKPLLLEDSTDEEDSTEFWEKLAKMTSKDKY